jgi:hypothetical protein
LIFLRWLKYSDTNEVDADIPPIRNGKNGISAIMFSMVIDY